MEHIKERIAGFTAFKEKVGRNEIICNKIQTCILLWKEDLETVNEKNEIFCQAKTTNSIG